MEKKTFSWKNLSNLFKVLAAVYFMFLTIYQVIKTGNLTLEFSMAAGFAAVILANIFISVDISMWIKNFQKSKQMIEGVSNVIINKD